MQTYHLAHGHAHPKIYCLAADTRGLQEGRDPWGGGGGMLAGDWQGGGAPADEPGLRDWVYGLMRPATWTAEASEPPGATRASHRVKG